MDRRAIITVTIFSGSLAGSRRALLITPRSVKPKVSLYFLVKRSKYYVLNTVCDSLSGEWLKDTGGERLLSGPGNLILTSIFTVLLHVPNNGVVKWTNLQPSLKMSVNHLRVFFS